MLFDSEKCTLQKLLHKLLHLKGFRLTPPNYTYLLQVKIQKFVPCLFW